MFVHLTCVIIYYLFCTFLQPISRSRLQFRSSTSSGWLLWSIVGARKLSINIRVISLDFSDWTKSSNNDSKLFGWFRWLHYCLHKLAFCFDNRYLSSTDCDFVQCILADVDRFVASSQLISRLVILYLCLRLYSLYRVLLFTPLSSYHRYLLHRSISDFYPFLGTVSIGDGDNRRTVIYFGEHLKRYLLILYIFMCVYSSIQSGLLLKSGVDLSAIIGDTRKQVTPEKRRSSTMRPAAGPPSKRYR